MNVYAGLSAADSPLAAAVARRDCDIAATVAEAVRHRMVRLAFQPVFPAGGGPPAFYESVARIMDGAGRILPAAEFVAAIEGTETGRRIDCLALELALTELLRAPTLRLSVNLSAHSLGYPRWRRVLARGLARDPDIGARLILEIAEDTAMRVPDLTLAFMQEHLRSGIAFALDDFGAGATRFRHLRRLPVDLIKIDGAFVRGIADDPDNQVTVRAFVAMAREFDMLTVAEHVETEADAAMLRSIGVDCLQGFLFAAPVLRPPWRSAGSHPA